MENTPSKFMLLTTEQRKPKPGTLVTSVCGSSKDLMRVATKALKKPIQLVP